MGGPAGREGGLGRETASHGMDGAWLGQPLPGKMQSSSKKQAALAGSVRRDTCRTEDRQPGPFPPPVVGPAQLCPSPEQQPHDLGRGVGQTRAQSRLGCLRASQRDGEALTEAQRAPCFRALSLTCKGDGQAARGSPSFLHSKQTRREQTKQGLEWSTLLPSRGAARPHRGGEPVISPTTPKVTQSDNTLDCPGLKQKPNHDPIFQKQPLENDTGPSGRWTSPQPSLEDNPPVPTAPWPSPGTHTCSLRAGGGYWDTLQWDGKNRGQQLL